VQSTTGNLRWLALVLVVVSVVLLAPFGPWLILALWIAGFARPLQRKLAARLGSRPRLAAALTTVLLFAITIPIAAVLASLAVEAYQLLVHAAKSTRGHHVLEQIASPHGPGPANPQEVITGAAARAWPILQNVAGTATHAVIGLLVFIAGVYSVLVDGSRWYAWLEDHAPIPRDATHRLAAAFHETGRGLFVGVVGSGVVQAVLATIAYYVLGISKAFALGVLTLVLSVIPAFGTALVWVPVAIGLALAHRPVAAIGLAAYCGIVIGAVDNLMKPYLAQRGRLQLPAYVVLLAMFGGIATLGAWGLMLAPLAVRLAKEALEIVRDAAS
jgi:predicted PurR-regulated permease PerM